MGLVFESQPDRRSGGIRGLSATAQSDQGTGEVNVALTEVGIEGECLPVERLGAGPLARPEPGIAQPQDQFGVPRLEADGLRVCRLGSLPIPLPGEGVAQVVMKESIRGAEPNLAPVGGCCLGEFPLLEADVGQCDLGGRVGRREPRRLQIGSLGVRELIESETGLAQRNEVARVVRLQDRRTRVGRGCLLPLITSVPVLSVPEVALREVERLRHVIGGWPLNDVGCRRREAGEVLRVVEGPDRDVGHDVGHPGGREIREPGRRGVQLDPGPGR